MARKIRCAVIGTGRIGSSLETDRLREKPASHAGAISRGPDTALVAGADPDADNLAVFGRQWRLPPSALFSDPGEMLDAVKPDIAHIAADTESHVPLLLLALERKVPVIVLEKPVGATLAEARGALAAVELTEKAGTSRVVVNHERRFAADYRRAREYIRSGTLGKLLSAQGILHMGLTKPPAQVLWHDGTHLVDALSFLIGPWDVTGSIGDVRSGTGNFLVLGKGPESVSVVIDASPGRDHLAFELDLGFCSGRIRVGNGIWEVWRSEPSRYYESFRSLTLTEGKPGQGFGKTGYFSGMMAHAVELFRNPTLPGESTYGDGLRALELLDAAISGAKPFN
jgi:predicted dehydrogenase